LMSHNDINIVIPMAGLGSRFKDVGYTVPKPLIPINDKPMIQIVIENLNIKGQYIFIVMNEHCENYQLDSLLKKVVPNCIIIKIDKLNDVAARSVLLAEKYINNNIPLVIANCDQFLEWNSNDFIYKAKTENLDALISTFNDTNPKWSFVKLNNELVCEVKQKQVISNIATTGIYYWKFGKDFVHYAKQMIEKNIRTN